MNRGLDPPYAPAIQTGYSTINRLADLLSSDHSLAMLALSNQLGHATDAPVYFIEWPKLSRFGSSSLT
jgi:hypothetical protein